MQTNTLRTLLAGTADRFPENDVLVSRGKKITYSELETASNQLAATLKKSGVKHGDRVAIMLNKSIESIISLFGILKAGAIYVPIDPQSPSARTQHIIKHCEIESLITSSLNWLRTEAELTRKTALKRVILTGSKIRGVRDPISDQAGKGARLKTIAWETINGASRIFEAARLPDTSPAYILHTSGSTGIPKGVAISHHNALSFVNMAADFFELSKNDRLCNHAPLHFDLSVFDLFGAVKAGAAIVLVPESLSAFPQALAELIEKERITVWNSVSSVLTMMADRGGLERFKFDALRLVHFSGDSMPVKYLRILKGHMKKAAFYNIYGQTEANSSLFFPVNSVPDSEVWKIPIGKPFPNFEVFAIDDAGKVIKNPGEEGELYIKGSTVALGYWGDDERTGERFVDDPRNPSSGCKVYRTGDSVRLDGNGNYVFAGRKDHMVKSRGYRIELDEIELVLNGHPAVKQAVVLAIPDEIIGNRIMTIVAPVAGASLTDSDLIDFCTYRLPKYMIPEIFRFSDALPTTSTGKVDRKTLSRGGTMA
jgi:amino acid adenylation domain-containing protein